MCVVTVDDQCRFLPAPVSSNCTALVLAAVQCSQTHYQVDNGGCMVTAAALACQSPIVFTEF